MCILRAELKEALRVHDAPLLCRGLERIPRGRRDSQSNELCLPGSPRSPASSSRRVEAKKEAAGLETAAPELGSEWVQVPNPDGRIFFHNPRTGQLAPDYPLITCGRNPCPALDRP